MSGGEVSETLTNFIYELERVVFSLDSGKCRGDNEALVAEFFKIFRSLGNVLGEGFEDVKNFPTFFDEVDLLECSKAFFIDWDARSKHFVVRCDEWRRVEFLRNGLQSLVWGLLGKILKHMPDGDEILSQAYEDMINGFEAQTDTDTLEILYKLGLDRLKAYRDYMSVKGKYRGEINGFKKLPGLRHILSLVNSEVLSFKVWVKVCDWWEKTVLISQLDTALSNEFDSLGFLVISLSTINMLERIYRREGVEGVQSILDNSKRMETTVRIHALSKLLGEDSVERLKVNPALIPILRRQLELCTMHSMEMLKIYTEKRLESCLKKGEGSVGRTKPKDPAFTVVYHTFFSPIILEGRKGQAHNKPEDVTVEQMLKQIEAFNPDRFKDFPLWYAKEKFLDKTSKTDQNTMEKLVRLFYKLMKGEVAVKTFHEKLSSI